MSAGWARRDVVKLTGVAAAAALIAPMISKALGKTGAAADPAPIGAVLIDRRYPDSRAFAYELAARGAQVFSTDEDLARLWRGELGALYARGRARVAGLTPHSDLFLSLALANETGIKAVCSFEGWHDCRGSDTLRHTLDGGAATRGLGAELDGAGAGWATALARRVADAAAAGRPYVHDASVAGTARTAGHPGSLISWVIG